MTTTFMAGSLVTSTATFANTAGIPTDPTTITLKYQEASNSPVTIVYPNAFITRVSAGVYAAELDTTGLVGPATVEWIGTGAVQAIGAATWTVTAAPL